MGQSELGQFQIRSGPTWDIPLSSIRRWFRSHSKQARFAPVPVSSTTSRRTAYALDPGSAEPSTREPCSNRPFSDLRPLRPQGPGRVCVHDPQVGALMFPTVALITSFWLAIRRIQGVRLPQLLRGPTGFNFSGLAEGRKCLQLRRSDRRLPPTHIARNIVRGGAGIRLISAQLGKCRVFYGGKGLPVVSTAPEIQRGGAS